MHSADYKIHTAEIGLNPPAYFLKRDSALPLFKFPEIGVAQIFMIAGGVKYIERDVPIMVKQIQALQGYVLNGNQLYPTKYFNFHTSVNFDNGADVIFIQIWHKISIKRIKNRCFVF